MSDHGHGRNSDQDDGRNADHGRDPANDDSHHRHDVDELDVAVLTVSSSRSLEDDPAGNVVQDAVEAAGNDVTVRELVPDSYDRVQDTVDRFVRREDTDCVVTTGGTGVTPDDVTPDAVDPLLDKRLPGFGELFRRLSADEIGTRVVGTRAFAGIAEGAPVFCLPGSRDAARLGTEEIILEEASHLAGLAKRDDDTGGRDADDTATGDDSTLDGTGADDDSTLDDDKATGDDLSRDDDKATGDDLSRDDDKATGDDSTRDDDTGGDHVETD